MKNHLSIVVVVITLASLCVAANTASSPAAPAGVVKLNAPSVVQVPVIPAQASLAPGEGAPIPWCPPPNGCPDDLRLMAGEGAPIPWCPPAHPDCNDGGVRLTNAAVYGYLPEFLVKPSVGFDGV